MRRSGQLLLGLCLLTILFIGAPLHAQDDELPFDLNPADCNTKWDYNTLGLEARDANEMALAVHHFSCAIKADSESFDAFFNRAYALGQLEEYELAVEDYTRAIDINPADSVVYNNRAWEYELLGETELSAADYLQHILIRRTVRDDWYTGYGYPQTIYMDADNYYRVWFDARAGDIIDIEVTSEDGSIDPLIVLTFEDDTPLIANDDRDLENEDYNSGIYGYIIPETGTYSLYVTQWNEDDTIGTLQVMVEAGVSY